MNSQSGGKPHTKGVTHGPQPKPSVPPPRADPLAKADEFAVAAEIVDHATKKPISGATCEVLDPAGKVIARPKSDWQGHISVPVKDAGAYKVRVLEVPKVKS